MKFEQNADGIQDCSVWRFCDEMTMIRMPDGTMRITNSLAWRPVKFGPMTREEFAFVERFLSRAESEVVKRAAERALSMPRRRN